MKKERYHGKVLHKIKRLEKDILGMQLTGIIARSKMGAWRITQRPMVSLRSGFRMMHPAMPTFFKYVGQKALYVRDAVKENIGWRGLIFIDAANASLNRQ